MSDCRGVLGQTGSSHPVHWSETHLQLFNLAFLVVLELLHVTFKFRDLFLSKFLLVLCPLNRKLEVLDGRLHLVDFAGVLNPKNK